MTTVQLVSKTGSQSAKRFSFYMGVSLHLRHESCVLYSILVLCIPIAHLSIYPVWTVPQSIKQLQIQGHVTILLIQPPPLHLLVFCAQRVTIEEASKLVWPHALLPVVMLWIRLLILESKRQSKDNQLKCHFFSSSGYHKIEHSQFRRIKTTE